MRFFSKCNFRFLIYINNKTKNKWQNKKIFDTYINISNDFGSCDFFSNWLKN